MADNSIEKSLKVAIFLTSIFLGVEVIGGFVSGSLSLLGDAGHMLRDVLALFISLSAINIAKKLPTKTKTFGYHRVEILAALLNGFLLIGISIWIFHEAYLRFFTPRTIRSITMFGVAFGGLLVNLYVAFKLHKSHDLNIKSAFIHVLSDTLSSIAVILASVWIFFTNQVIVDPILSVVIAAFILISALAIIKDALYILLEFTPKNINLNEIIQEIEKVKKVQAVHNVHLWSLCSNINVLDAHIFTTASDILELERIKKEIKRNLEKYNIKHATLEFECEECKEKDKIHPVNH